MPSVFLCTRVRLLTELFYRTDDKKRTICCQMILYPSLLFYNPVTSSAFQTARIQSGCPLCSYKKESPWNIIHPWQHEKQYSFACKTILHKSCSCFRSRLCLHFSLPHRVCRGKPNKAEKSASLLQKTVRYSAYTRKALSASIISTSTIIIFSVHTELPLFLLYCRNNHARYFYSYIPHMEGIQNLQLQNIS